MTSNLILNVENALSLVRLLIKIGLFLLSNLQEEVYHQ